MSQSTYTVYIAHSASLKDGISAHELFTQPWAAPTRWWSNPGTSIPWKHHQSCHSLLTLAKQKQISAIIAQTGSIFLWEEWSYILTVKLHFLGNSDRLFIWVFLGVSLDFTGAEFLMSGFKLMDLASFSRWRLAQLFLNPSETASSHSVVKLTLQHLPRHYQTI